MPGEGDNGNLRRRGAAGADAYERERAARARERAMRDRERAQSQNGRSTRRVVIDGRESALRKERAQEAQRARQVDRSQAKRQDGHRPDGYRQGASRQSAGRQNMGRQSYLDEESYRNAEVRRESEARREARQASGRTSRQTPRRDLPYSSVASRSRGRRSRGLQVGTVQPDFGYVGSSRSSRLPRIPQLSQIPPIALIIAAVVILLILIFAIRGCMAGAGEGDASKPDGQTTAAVTMAQDTSDTSDAPIAAASASASSAGETAASETETASATGTAASARPVSTAPARVSFVAVGDNLPDDLIGYWADAQAGEENDGTYDYTGLYKYIKPYIQQADLAYIDQETHLGGNDIGPRGYPSFNVTDEMADAVVSTGFDFVASATNHSYDWGLYGALENSLRVWEAQPVAFTGTAVTEDQYNRIATLERDGITFALLNYTYGVNWPDDMELPEHSINLIDEERITRDVARAKKEADVVLVAMHWGTELLMEADEQQQHLAQLLANLDVDVVLGSHPHVIGPVAWVANENGSGHKTLVAYSLGNFLSDHEARSPQVELEGMLCCDFVRGGSSTAAATVASETETDSSTVSASKAATDASTIRIENARWVPLVNHTNQDRTDFAVYALKDYTNDLGKLNAAYADADVKDPVKWLDSTTREVVGTAIPIDDGRTVVANDLVGLLATGAANAATKATFAIEA